MVGSEEGNSSLLKLVCGGRGAKRTFLDICKEFRQIHLPAHPGRAERSLGQDFESVRNRGPTANKLHGPRRESGCARSPLPRLNGSCVQATPRDDKAQGRTTPCFPYRYIICNNNPFPYIFTLSYLIVIILSQIRAFCQAGSKIPYTHLPRAPLLRF